MAERKAVNKYYPPDWDPSKGSVNKHVGQHPLRERARKLSQGILIIRFEMPYNIWCGGCGNHIGMGVRYNAEKKKVGNYYTTPIYRFRMKCHLCDNYIEIETDPKNCDYTIVAGARRKEERWDPAAAENVIATDHADKQKLIDDAMFKLEHGEKDKRKSKAAIPGLLQIKDIQTQWKDDFALNQMLRKKFRQEKKVILQKEEKDQKIKDKGGLDLELVNEDPDDIALAKNIRFRDDGYEEDKRKRRLQIKSRPMFSKTSGRVSQRTSLLEKRQKMALIRPHLTKVSTKNSEDFGIRRKRGEGVMEKECSSNVTQEQLKIDKTTDENLTDNLALKTNSESTSGEEKCRINECVQLRNKSCDNTVNSSREHDTMNNVAIQKLGQNDKQHKCDLQQSENIEILITDKSQTMSVSKHEKASEQRMENVSPTKTEILYEKNGYQTTGSKTSLVSEMYSDTDSDSSK